jgi:hypothetical protein
MKTVTKIKLAIGCGLLCLHLNAETIVNGGSISGKWTKADSPYIINSNVTVESGAILEIEAGVNAAFAKNAGLIVSGQLFAVGTETDSIVFAAQSDTWYGLSLQGVDESEIKYAVIKNANIVGGIGIYAGEITVANCLITRNSHAWGYGGGICIDGGDIKLVNNTIINNFSSRSGSGIYMGGTIGASVHISNNIISNNNCYEYGGGIFIARGSATIADNIISENSATIGGGGVWITNNVQVDLSGNLFSKNFGAHGGGIFMQNSTVNVVGNQILDNEASYLGGGISVSEMDANIYSNVICNNFVERAIGSSEGGAISLRESNSTIVNNTIAFNDAESGSGIFCSLASSPLLINNILYGNTTTVFIADENSVPVLLNNLNQYNKLFFGSGVDYDWQSNYDKSNFDANPQFVDYLSRNYRLDASSPCIDAGLENLSGLNIPEADADKRMRVHGPKIDVGAYEYGAYRVDINEIKNQQQAIIYPNPSPSGLFQIGTESPKISWTIYNLNGKLLQKGNTPQINISNYKKGVYLISIKTENGVFTSKLIR